MVSFNVRRTADMVTSQVKSDKISFASALNSAADLEFGENSVRVWPDIMASTAAIFWVISVLQTLKG